MNAPLLEVRNLRTEFATRDGVLPAVADVSFDLARGEVLGLVGESGSGKSVTGFSIIGLIDPPGRIAGTRYAEPTPAVGRSVTSDMGAQPVDHAATSYAIP